MRISTKEQNTRRQKTDNKNYKLMNSVICICLSSGFKNRPIGGMEGGKKIMDRH
ncbi:MAG TPA: hypothetical protein VIM42_11975 [Clostridium sp.]